MGTVATLDTATRTDLRTWREAFLDIQGRPMLAAWAARFPDHAPFDLSRFDGCTMVPDIALWACLEHDLGYHYQIGRREADRTFRTRIAEMAEGEDNALGRVFWHALAWTAWAGVRAFGWIPYYLK